MFRRDVSILKEMQLYEKYSDFLNINNFESISRLQLYKIFKNVNVTEKEIYFHLLLSKWIDNEGKFDESKLKRMKKLIRKYSIIPNQIEKEELLILEERTFAFGRVIKSLQVSFELDPKEEVNARISGAYLFKEKNNFLFLLDKGEFILSNQGLKVVGKNKNKYTFKSIKKFKFANYGFEFRYRTNTFLVRTMDSETLNNTIKNYFSKKDQGMLKKEKNEWN